VSSPPLPVARLRGSGRRRSAYFRFGH